jgi:uncharacterized protein (DUF1499 family)
MWSGLTREVSFFQYFIEPLDYGMQPRFSAIQQLVDAIEHMGGTIAFADESHGLVKATFTASPLFGLLRTTDTAEFLLERDNVDTVCNVYTASDDPTRPDIGRNRLRVRELKQQLGWEYVPVLRNRKRVLGVLESPLDSFGPEPPLDSLEPERPDDILDPI